MKQGGAERSSITSGGDSWHYILCLESQGTRGASPLQLRRRDERQNSDL
jgi:hypothetical protein